MNDWVLCVVFCLCVVLEDHIPGAPASLLQRFQTLDIARENPCPVCKPQANRSYFSTKYPFLCAKLSFCETGVTSKASPQERHGGTAVQSVLNSVAVTQNVSNPFPLQSVETGCDRCDRLLQSSQETGADDPTTDRAATSACMR